MPDPARPDTPIVAVAGSMIDPFRAGAPEGVEVVAIDDGLDLETVDFIVPRYEDSWVLEELPGLSRLKVVQTVSTGTDWIEDLVPAGTTLCNARGARDAPVAQWVVGALLGASAQLLESARLTTWTDRHVDDLDGWTVLILGMGSIGGEVARMLEPIGPRVVGVASRAREGLHGIDELPDLLPQADAVVLLTPLTDSTEGLIGGAELAAMRDGALLVNAARGAVVDTDALVAEVSTGRIRAILDVVDPEPLPDGHPLWTAPGVLAITPHVAGDSPFALRRAIDLALLQLTRWNNGEELENVVRAGSA